MASSLAARRLLYRAAASRRLVPCALSTPPRAAPAALRRFSAEASTPPPTTPPPPPPPLEPTVEPPKSEGASSSASSSAGAGGAHRSSPGAAAGARRTGGTGYEEEQEKVLRASLLHVPRMGWSESAMIAGARDVGVSPAIVGAFPRKEAALVEFFMDDCLQQLIDRIDAGEGELLKNLVLSERLSKLVRMRLEMQGPYISKWPQALSIQSQPANISTSLKQRAVLVDEIWHAAGDAGSDIDWYVKRTVLGGIYSTSEVYMLTDNSPEWPPKSSRLSLLMATTFPYGDGSQSEPIVTRIIRGYCFFPTRNCPIGKVSQIQCLIHHKEPYPFGSLKLSI